jgi:hypothetical protein
MAGQGPSNVRCLFYAHGSAAVGATAMTQPPDQPPRRFPLRLALRLGAAVLVIAFVAFLVSGTREKRTVQEVIDEIHGIALDEPRGGLIGRWWVSASGVNPETGRLQSFKLECGPVHIAARSARVVVNPHTDSFEFEMWDVVMAKVPEPGDDENDDTLRVLNRFTVGPLPYRTDIVPDKNANRPPAAMLPTE